MKKRIISLLLCLCMVFSLLPTAVLAADSEDPDASAGSGQVMQQKPEDSNDQSDSGDQEDLGDQAGQNDLKKPENSDVLPDSENVGSLNILKAPAKGSVASIGSVEYPDLQAAITAAQPGETVKLLQDIANADGKGKKDNQLHNGAFCHIDFFLRNHEKYPF